MSTPAARGIRQVGRPGSDALVGGASDRGKNGEERAGIDEQGPAGRRLDQD